MKVTISQPTLDLLVRDGAGRHHAKPLGDGRYQIQLKPVTVDRLGQFAFPGESLDDAILRLFSQGRPQ